MIFCQQGELSREKQIWELAHQYVVNTQGLRSFCPIGVCNWYYLIDNSATQRYCHATASLQNYKSCKNCIYTVGQSVHLKIWLMTLVNRSSLKAGLVKLHVKLVGKDSQTPQIGSFSPHTGKQTFAFNPCAIKSQHLCLYRTCWVSDSAG